MWWRAALVLLACVASCLPEDPPGFRRDAGIQPRPTPPKRGLADAGRLAAARPLAVPSARPVGSVAPSLALTAPFRDDFERSTLGADWHATSPVWSIRDGQLCGQGAKNHPVWLARRLPRNARIEFSATSGSPNGDIKAEAWGDGQSAAKGTSYDDATGYIVVFGGWKNSLHVVARLQEHASNRLETRLVPGSEDLRTAPVVEGKSYDFELERSDGRTLRFSVDGALIHAFEDPAPLFGQGHDSFAFNDWDVPVCFDDVLVTPLGG